MKKVSNTYNSNFFSLNCYLFEFSRKISAILSLVPAGVSGRYKIIFGVISFDAKVQGGDTKLILWCVVVVSDG